MRLGGFDASLLERCRLVVVVRPGVSLTGPFFDAARARGLTIVGDIELFARAARAPVVGITGTNGKSTVTTLLARMAQRAGVKVRAGGNLGAPALDLLDGGAELYVLELSSFQLETTAACIAGGDGAQRHADHLDRYASLASYAAAKARIFARCDTAVINLDDPLVAAMPRTGRTLRFSLRASIGADYALALNAGEWWLMHAASRCCRWPSCACGGRTTPPMRSPRSRSAMRSRCRWRRCSRSSWSSPACRTARSGWPTSAASATSTTPRAPTSARRSRRSPACPARWC